MGFLFCQLGSFAFGLLGVRGSEPQTFFFSMAAGYAVPMAPHWFRKKTRRGSATARLVDTVNLSLAQWLQVHIDNRASSICSRLARGETSTATDRLYERNLASLIRDHVARTPKKQKDTVVKRCGLARGVAKLRQRDIKLRRLAMLMGVQELELALAATQDKRRLRVNHGHKEDDFPDWPVGRHVANGIVLETIGRHDDRRQKSDDRPRPGRWWESDDAIEAVIAGYDPVSRRPDAG